MKSKKRIAALCKKIVAYFTAKAFCNIAEGTHAGSITMTAAADIDAANLIVKAGSNANSVSVAGATDKPMGVCLDEADSGDAVAVALSGCAESTFMCTASSDVAMGATLYTAASGKVSTTAANGSYKVGIALCDASSGGKVEVDPVGFGERAWQVYACGNFVWTDSTSSADMACTGVLSDDLVFATLNAAVGSETLVSASTGTDKVSFTLSTNGTAAQTKITWMIIRKN